MRNLDANSMKGHGKVPGIVSGTRLRRPHHRSLVRRIFAEQDGQMIAWAGLMMAVMLGTGAVVVDVAHAMVVQHQLQSSADAAALAAAGDLSSSNFSSMGQSYSGAAGGANAKGYTITGPTITGLCLTTLKTLGVSCDASTSTWNAVSAKETATVNTYFGWILGMKTITVSATSWAAAKGSVPMPYNVAIIVDSTLSMTATDSNCGSQSQMSCALSGVQQLLLGLYPSTDHVALFTFPNVARGSAAGTATNGSSFNCTTAMPSSYTTGGVTTQYAHSSSWGYYSMLDSSTRGGPTYETPWTGVAWAEPYTFPAAPTGTSGYTTASGSLAPTYEVVGFSTDYRTSNAATSLNSASNIVKASGAVSGCNGITTSNYDGDYGTYYAGALYAAQAALLAEQPKNPNSQNVIVMLGDGNSTAPGPSGSPDHNSPAMPISSTQSTTTFGTNSALTTSAYTFPSSYYVAEQNGTGYYPSATGECGQAVDAAQYAATYSGNNTLVYTVAYGASTQSSSSYCASDRYSGTHAGISPCQTLQLMATGGATNPPSKYFYSDYTAQGGDTGCQANTANNAITSLNQIFQHITLDLTNIRLIPVNTP